MQELKFDLKKRSESWLDMTETEKDEIRYKYGDYPEPAQNSVVYRLWEKHNGPWHKGWGYIRRDKERDAKTMERLRPMIDAINRFQGSRDKKEG